MSKKEELFSKLNIKDYNNQLENILENKDFTEDAKNILLNILYKIETAYDDYSKVKVFVPLKKELLEEIIKIVKEKCNEIEIIKPRINGETKLKDKRYIIENDRIIAYQNEKNVFYALNHLNDDLFLLNTKYETLKKPMQKLFNQGYIIDKEEIIRDFDGWTWNITANDIENYSYNAIYQNIRILLGIEFIQKIMNDRSIDFVIEFENKIKEKFEKENNFANLIYQISILEYIEKNKDEKENILKTRKDLEQQLEQMNNKKEYLQKIAFSKKEIGRKIKAIDEKINNNKLLKESFIEENKKLEENEQIFSLSEYSEILQKQRNELLKELDNLSKLMKPMNFIKKKEKISKEYEILNGIILETRKVQVSTLIKNLQKEFLKLFNEKISGIQTKKDILHYIYLFRYYKLIYVNESEQIKDLKEIDEEIRMSEKHLITKACKLKAMNILSTNIEENYKLVSKILDYNIIELEDVNLEFRKQDKNIIIEIFDDEVIEDTIICDLSKELNVKFNKKIKLFS